MAAYHLDRATGQDAGYPRRRILLQVACGATRASHFRFGPRTSGFPLMKPARFRRADIVRCLTLLGCLTPPQAFLAGEYG
jgi:hypothetical protein